MLITYMFICINLTDYVLYHIFLFVAFYPEDFVAFASVDFIPIFDLVGFLFHLDIFEHVYGGKLSHGVR
jgi:hypothetical protein